MRFILGELFDTWSWQPNDRKWFWLDGIESCCVGVEGSSKSICVTEAFLSFSSLPFSLPSFPLFPRNAWYSGYVVVYYWTKLWSDSDIKQVLRKDQKKESGANLIKHFNAQLTDHKGQAAKVIFIYIKIQNYQTRSTFDATDVETAKLTSKVFNKKEILKV